MEPGDAFGGSTGTLTGEAGLALARLSASGEGAATTDWASPPSAALPSSSLLESVSSQRRLALMRRFMAEFWAGCVRRDWAYQSSG